LHDIAEIEKSPVRDEDSLWLWQGATVALVHRLPEEATPFVQYQLRCGDVCCTIVQTASPWRSRCVLQQKRSAFHEDAEVLICVSR